MRDTGTIGTLLVAGCLSLSACESSDAPANTPANAPESAAASAATATDAQADAQAFEFEEVVPGIFHARGTGAMAVGSHGAIIVNDDDVLVVDSHISPAAARALLSDLEAITDKPVRYVVNTHYHFDHAHGNQVYPTDVHVIGHEFTREMLENGGSLGRSYEMFVGRLPDQIAAAEAELEAATGAERDQLETRVAYLRDYWEGQQELEPQGPNTTLSERMTLFRGDREIRMLFFGRGHTGGDVVVHLPRERILATGDLLVPGLPYMGDGHVEEWIETLEHLKSLEFDWVLPGHGTPFQGTERITSLQAYMRALYDRVLALHGQGLSFEETAARVDMRDFADRYPQITDVGVPEVTVQRIFELLEEGS